MIQPSRIPATGSQPSSTPTTIWATYPSTNVGIATSSVVETRTRLSRTMTSFAPLWLGLAVLGIPGSGWAALPLYVLAAISPMALWAYLRSVRRINATEQKVVRAFRRDQDLLGYVAAYLIPFAFINADGLRAMIVLGLFLLLVIGLSVHARIYYVNPLLAVARYRIFEVELGNGATVVLMTRHEHLPVGTSIRTRTIDQHVYIDA
jgi:hypothetical protein